MTKHSTPTINFFEMMGISEEELSYYLIRLNKSSANWFDVMTLYYEKHDELMNWVFTRRWNSNGRNNSNMTQSKVLQFIQLDGNENPPTHWLFVGGYEILGTHVEDEREIYGWKSIERFQPFEAV
ncbi:hypothetical protein [Bifidobacterium pseudolongum]|uniref:hypothetical protein n=1 Tax=Bifidobacterium pseudolongum TaxID=1694 RepID=UPI00216AC9A3|nr:hypothetical protein [Bifidobacterium pseudolongum]